MAAMNGQALHTLVAAIVRRTWLLGLVSVVVCAAFAASAVTALFEASYLAPSAEGAKLPTPSAALPEVTVAPRNGDEMVARDMFCSSCTPTVEAAAAGDSFTPAAILIATSVGEDPRATVRVPSSEAQGSYGLDDKIPGVGKVTRIGWRSIDVLDDSGRHGKLDLLDQVAAGGAGAATPAAAATPDPFEGRIKKIDDHTFEVDRELVKELVSGAVKPGAMRVQPLPDGNGGMKGLKLFGIRGTSLAGTVGLQNGDTLVAINNNKIQNAQSLLDVYTHMDTMNVVELDGTRGDKPLALTLRLR
ncbi:MAG: hypothetical protein ABI591_26985 [Kofleriaceae bacterium]